VQSSVEGTLCVMVLPTFPFSKLWALTSIVGDVQCSPVGVGNTSYKYDVLGLPQGSLSVRLSFRSGSPNDGMRINIAGSDCGFVLVQHCTSRSCHLVKQLDVVTGGAQRDGTDVVTMLTSVDSGVLGVHDEFHLASRYTVGMSLLELGDISSATFALSFSILCEPGEAVFHAALALLSLRPPVDADAHALALSSHRFDLHASVARIQKLEQPLRQFLEIEGLTNFRVTRSPVLGGKFTAFPSVLHAYDHADPAPLVVASAYLLGRLYPEITSFIAPHLAIGTLPSPPRRVRVGFLSTAFYDHALGRALAGVVLKLAGDPSFQVSCVMAVENGRRVAVRVPTCNSMNVNAIAGRSVSRKETVR
jgi:hypothetical protein